MSERGGWSPFFGGRGEHEGAAQARRNAMRTRRVEQQFGVQLRRLARHIGEIVNGMYEADPTEWLRIEQALEDYSRLIEPWARAVAERMLAEVSRRDAAGWHQLGKMVHRGLLEEIATAPIGPPLRLLLANEVHLITSLPREAAERVHQLSLEAFTGGRRWEEIAADLKASGQVSASRANTIARTETGRAATDLTKVRAEHIGSPGYVWRTARDRDVRKRHRELEGTFHRWDDPPVASDEGQRVVHAHPGAIYNCFPGSIEVSLGNGCHYLWRHWYQGPLVVIEFEGGRLELTPNHPILTARGWLAAKEIKTTDSVIQSLGRDFVPSAKQEYKDESQPSFDQIFRAFDCALGRQTAGGFVADFHGERPDYDVDAIRTDHLLPGNRPSPLFERLGDLAFARTDRWMRSAVDRCGLHVSEACQTRRADQSFALLCAHALQAADIGLRWGSPLHTMPFQNPGKCRAVAPEAERQRQFAFAGSVSLDDHGFRQILAAIMASRNAVRDFNAATPELIAQRVVMHANIGGGIFEIGAFGYQPLRVLDKSVRQFSGHVFTMQTANGWFSVTSSRIMAKNCRCWAEPVLAMGDLDQAIGPLPRNPGYLAALREAGYTGGTAFEG